MKKLVMLFIACVLVFAPGAGYAAEESIQAQYWFSFENGLEGWERKGTDLEHEPGALNWAVDPVIYDEATHGSQALQFTLENYNGMGKIWAERAFNVEPNTTYWVTLGYDITSFCSDTEIAQRIVGVSATSPTSREDLAPMFRGSLSNGEECEQYLWQRHYLRTQLRSTAEGKLYVVLGIWGTWETPMTVYVDDVNVRLSKLY